MEAATAAPAAAGQGAPIPPPIPTRGAGEAGPSGAGGGAGTAAAAGPPPPKKQRSGPIPVQVVNGDGFIWDADDARRLRADHRLVGAMVGSVAGFKQQNSFCGLPLRLGPAELAVAVRRGWAAPYEVPCDPSALDPFHSAPAAAPGGAAAAADPSAPPPLPAWRAQVVKGTPYAVPLTHASTPRVALERGAVAAGATAAAAAAAPGAPASAVADARAAAAFADLHARGYALTPGGNFGADWLAYPADPVLYHAQLAVRAGGAGNEALDPTLLAAAARGAHAARKHLVLAVPCEGGAGVFYLTIAPEAGFGPAA